MRWQCQQSRSAHRGLQKVIDDASESTANRSNAFNNRGNAYLSKREHDRAIVDYGEAIKLDPKYVAPLYNRGLAHAGKRDFDRAIADYSQALAINPKHVNAYDSRGLAYYSKRDYDRAIVDYNEAIKLDPKHSRAYAHRGVLFWGQGRLGGVRSPT